MLAFSWQRCYSNFKADFRLWCYFVVLQQLGRIGFIAVLTNYLAPTTDLGQVVQSLGHGLRFDSLWATVWIFIPLFLITLPSMFFEIDNYIGSIANKMRYVTGGMFTAVTIGLYVVSIEYFREYKDLFNQFLFNFAYDDKLAILKTIWAEHHVLPYIMLLLVLVIIYSKWLHSRITIPIKFGHKSIFRNKHHSWWQKLLLSALIIGFYVVAFRGGIGPRPIQLKDAGVTPDPFLNKAIVSPYSALKYAVKEQQLVQQQDQYRATNVTLQNVKNIAQKFFHTKQEYEQISAYLHRTARGTMLPAVNHVFLIIGESLDAWPLQAEYKHFALTPNLNKLMAQGLYLKNFLPCADGTMATINTLVTGLPDQELHVNYQPGAYQAYPTALATQVKALGFKPQFFYGGYLSWQRLEDFVKAQGFEEVYGAAHISGWQHTNEWGVDDKTLFNFIKQQVQAASKPTFNVIMTTSNHPPYSINLAAEGFSAEQSAKILAEHPNTTTNAKELGHIWYADKAIGEFVADVNKNYPEALFAITGDHFGRKHIAPNPSLFDVSAVPLILYGAHVQRYYRFAANVAGSHLDLGATLLELIAPRGFGYYALGNNLLGWPKNTLGFGRQKIITSDFIAAVGSDEIMYLQQQQSPKDLAKLAAYKQHYRDAMDLAWWLIKRK